MENKKNSSVKFFKSCVLWIKKHRFSGTDVLDAYYKVVEFVCLVGELLVTAVVLTLVDLGSNYGWFFFVFPYLAIRWITRKIVVTYVWIFNIITLSKWRNWTCWEQDLDLVIKKTWWRFFAKFILPFWRAIKWWISLRRDTKRRLLRLYKVSIGTAIVFEPHTAGLVTLAFVLLHQFGPARIAIYDFGYAYSPKLKRLRYTAIMRRPLRWYGNIQHIFIYGLYLYVLLCYVNGDYDPLIRDLLVYLNSLDWLTHLRLNFRHFLTTLADIVRPAPAPKEHREKDWDNERKWRKIDEDNEYWHIHDDYDD